MGMGKAATGPGRPRRALLLAGMLGVLVPCGGCTPSAPRAPADPYASTVRLEVNFKRVAQSPSLGIDATATNLSDTALGDVRAMCVQTGLGGGRLATATLVFPGPIAPRAAATLADVDTGFLRPSESRVTCRVQSVGNAAAANR